jgi:hypothetical protein
MKTLRPERMREGVGKECPGTPYRWRVVAPVKILSRKQIRVNREIATKQDSWELLCCGGQLARPDYFLM